MPRKKMNNSQAQHASTPELQGGRFSFDGLDRVMHEKARLSIMASLAANDRGLLFSDLKQLCGLTDGNLNRHLAVLSEAGLIEIWKGSSGHRPQTMVRLTMDGRNKFTEYINLLAKIVAQAQADSQTDTNRGLSGDWAST